MKTMQDKICLELRIHLVKTGIYTGRTLNKKYLRIQLLFVKKIVISRLFLNLKIRSSSYLLSFDTFIVETS